MNCQFLVVMNSMMEENNDEFTSELYPLQDLKFHAFHGVLPQERKRVMIIL